jgi:hypothetical protein
LQTHDDLEHLKHLTDARIGEERPQPIQARPSSSTIPQFQFECYSKLDFAIPVGKNGDNYDRYCIRMEEMRGATGRGR